MQPHYHRLDWLVRGLYVKRGGWVDGVNRLVRHTRGEEAKRMLPLLGGRDKVNEFALQAFKSGDYRWAVQLASTVLQVHPDDRTAAEIQKQSYQGIANTTRSANERNYLLAKIRAADGKLPWNRALISMSLPARMGQSDAELLKLMEDRFMSEISWGIAQRVAVQVEGEDAVHSLRIRNGVLIYEGTGRGGDHDGSFSVSHEDLAKLATGATPWGQAIESGAVKVVDGPDAVRTLTSLIEVEFP